MKIETKFTIGDIVEYGQLIGKVVEIIVRESETSCKIEIAPNRYSLIPEEQLNLIYYWKGVRLKVNELCGNLEFNNIIFSRGKVESLIRTMKDMGIENINIEKIQIDISYDDLTDLLKLIERVDI